MKRLLYYIPSILVLGFLAIVLLALGDPSGYLQDYLLGAGILLVFLLSDFLLSKKLWFAISLCLIIYGIIRHRNQNSCTQAFIWAAITGAYPLLLLAMLFLAGALGIGPVPT